MSSTYFLAGSDAEAVDRARSLAELPESDLVNAHQLITVPHLSSLADLAERHPVEVDPSAAVQVWPTMPDDPTSDLSWMGEPTIERISDALRDRIAAIELATLVEWIPTWATEVSGAVESDACEPLARELVSLSRRACERQLGLYNRYEF